MAKPNLLNSIKVTSPKMSGFDMSHDVKLSGNMGKLIPVACIECVPSDRIQISQEALVRLAPMVAPMMHRCDVSFHNFFVPTRLVWPNFDKWITNQKVGGALPAFPTINFGDSGIAFPVAAGQLADYMGIPISGDPLYTEFETVSAVPFAAYQMIYNEYYRNQVTENEVLFELSDGDNTAGPIGLSLTQLRDRAWEHDYFTAAAPEAQAGDPVSIPVLQNFPDVAVKVDQAGYPTGTVLTGTPSNVPVDEGTPTPGLGSIYAETSELNPSTPTTINDLRTAFRLQEWLEKSMRGGRRLFENILIFFGLRSPDMRMQRPEYIGGSKSAIQISEVLNTTGTEDAPQGTMAGHGVAVAQPKNSTYKVQEWGYVITIMSVMPKTAYQQGIPRHFLKHTDPMQIYWPQFDHLGEQEIAIRELFAYSTDSDVTFGYIPRYSEYKFMNSRVCGEFATTLDFWHMGRIFDVPPFLNSSFVLANPTHRVFAVTDENVHKLWMHVYHKIKMIRPMSKYSTPTF